MRHGKLGVGGAPGEPVGLLAAAERGCGATPCAADAARGKGPGAQGNGLCSRGKEREEG